MNRLSFRHRVFLSMAATTLLALLCACLLFFGMRVMAHRSGVARDLQVQAAILEGNAAAVVLFEDVEGGETLLQGLGADPRMLFAALYDEQGAIVASYARQPDRPAPVEPGADGLQRSQGLISYVEPLIHDGEQIGHIVIAADAVVVAEQMRQYGIMACVVFVLALFLAFLAGNRLSRSLVDPIRTLSQDLARVGNEGDYSVRVQRQSRDEIGDLVDTVNYMLNEIEARDQALVESRTRLEVRVRQRTRDLARAKEAAELSAGSLRVSEERFRSLSTAAPLGIFQVDVAGRFVYCNPRLLEMFSATRDDVMGYGWSRRLSRADQRWLRSCWASVDSAGWSREFELDLGPLGIRWLHFAASPSDLAGSRAGTVADVTERRRAEAERETLNTQLREASRRAGMAEVATGVLHNVGNVLNSVNVSATFLCDRLKNSRGEAVGRLAQLVGEQPDFGVFASSDPRGRLLPTYLNKLATTLQEERDELVQEVDGLRNHIDHIKQIVVMQQSLARAGGVTERCSPVDMVEEALGIDSESFRKHDIAVIREFDEAPEVVVDRHKMLQILINLITNAKHAIKEGDGKRELVAELLWSDTDGLTIHIKDSGVGIGPENLDRVFNHGFTSRRDGHGFGLHSSAIAAKEMGGSLVGNSEGPGCGAVFTVKLPASIRAEVQDRKSVV